MPFLWKDKKEVSLKDLLVQATKQKNFVINLNGFDAFPPKTIYIKNTYSAELMEFQKRLALYAKRHMNLFNATHNRGYNPHMTIAFRDLRKDKFEEAWAEFEHKPFDHEWEVSSFWLLKHDGKCWNAYREFQFSE